MRTLVILVAPTLRDSPYEEWENYVPLPCTSPQLPDRSTASGPFFLTKDSGNLTSKLGEGPGIVIVIRAHCMIPIIVISYSSNSEGLACMHLCFCLCGPTALCCVYIYIYILFNLIELGICFDSKRLWLS